MWTILKDEKMWTILNLTSKDKTTVLEMKNNWI